ncbi:MAG: hypothetical protein AAF623_06375 [Planctomycetota bacterium]
MANIVAVLWHLNTYTSASTPKSLIENQLYSDIKNDLTFNTNFYNWCAVNSLTPQDGFDELVNVRFEKRNQRNPFTNLNSAQRLNELETAVATARKWASETVGTPDLVFVAPEYLFAKDGYRHLLDAGEIDTIKARLKSISKNNPQTLMFPGTIAFRQSMNNRSVKSRVQLFEDMNFWKKNETGFKADWVDEQNKNKIAKIAMRGPNFEIAQNKSFAFLNGRQLLDYTKRGDFHEVTAQDDTGQEAYVPGTSSGTLQAFGKSFGTEICLDHNMGYASTAGKQPDIHVIMSAAVKPDAANENTVGKTPNKVGFVIHASCEKDFTSAVKWNGGVRTVLNPSWESSTGFQGSLLGYKLSFSSATQNMGPTGPAGNVKDMIAKFSP